MMRQSRAPNAPSPAAQARLREKKKEYSAVSALDDAAILCLQRLEGMADNVDVMADTGQGAFIQFLQTLS